MLHNRNRAFQIKDRNFLRYAPYHMFTRINTKYYFRLYIHEESGRKGLGENWLQAVQQKCKLIQEQRSVDIDEPAVMVSLLFYATK